MLAEALKAAYSKIRSWVIPTDKSPRHPICDMLLLPECYTTHDSARLSMAMKFNSSELVTFIELLVVSSIQVDALAHLLIDKGSQIPLIPI
jgi:hypothetical protein